MFGVGLDLDWVGENVSILVGTRTGTLSATANRHRASGVAFAIPLVLLASDA